jgi:hypothetical protein
VLNLSRRLDTMIILKETFLFRCVVDARTLDDHEKKPYLGKYMSVKRIAKSPIEELLLLIGSRWKLVILSSLLVEDRPVRFKLIRERIPAFHKKYQRRT